MIYFIGYMLIGLAIAVHGTLNTQSELIEFYQSCGIDNDRNARIVMGITMVIIAMSWPICMLLVIYVRYF